MGWVESESVRQRKGERETCVSLLFVKNFSILTSLKKDSSDFQSKYLLLFWNWQYSIKTLNTENKTVLVIIIWILHIAMYTFFNMHICRKTVIKLLSSYKHIYVLHCNVTYVVRLFVSCLLLTHYLLFCWVFTYCIGVRYGLGVFCYLMLGHVCMRASSLRDLID